MTTLQLIKKNKGLVEAFKIYQKRYLNVGKKPDIAKLLPEDLYYTMRLEAQDITLKEAQDLFQL